MNQFPPSSIAQPLPTLPPPSNIPGYHAAAIRRRRSTFFAVVGITLMAGVWLLAVSLGRNGYNLIDFIMLGVFTPLFYQLSVGFWTALIGLYLLMRNKKDPFDLSGSLTDDERRAEIGASTAIIMPVYNEDVSRVFEGLRVIYLSLEKTGQLEHFDFFVLSDSDNPNKWVEEELAWLELCRQLNGFGRIFYRKRRKPINRKSGNVSDFCRRWGNVTGISTLWMRTPLCQVICSPIWCASWRSIPPSGFSKPRRAFSERARSLAG